MAATGFPGAGMLLQDNLTTSPISTNVNKSGYRLIDIVDHFHDKIVGDTGRMLSYFINWLAKNPEITLQDFDDHINFFNSYDEGWNGLSENPNLTLDFIRKYRYRPLKTISPIENRKETPWNWGAISRNGIIRPEDLISDPYYVGKIDWNLLSENPSLTYETVMANSNRPWAWLKILRNPNISLEDLYKITFKPSHQSLTSTISSWFSGDPDLQKWEALSANPGLTIDFIQRHPDEPWNFTELFQNPNIDWNSLITNPIIRPYIDSKYLINDQNIILDSILLRGGVKLGILNLSHVDPEEFLNNRQAMDKLNNMTHDLSMNPNLTLDIVRRHPEVDWNWYEISKNPNITPQELNDSEFTNQVDWTGFSFNPNLTTEIIVANKKIPWNWLGIFENPNIDPTELIDIPEFSNKPHFWANITRSENLNLDTIFEMPDKEWDWTNLVMNYKSPSLIKSAKKKR